MKINEFYCVGLRKKITVKLSDICIKKLKNGRYVLKAHCSKNNTNVTKFIKNEDIEKMKKKFEKCNKSKKKSKKKSTKKSKKCKYGVKKSGSCKKKPGRKVCK